MVLRVKKKRVYQIGPNNSGGSFLNICGIYFLNFLIVKGMELYGSLQNEK